MNRSTVKGIAIGAGIIMTFLLWKFLWLPPPVGRYLNSWTIAHVILAALALFFGPIVGGVVGLFSYLLSRIIPTYLISLESISFPMIFSILRSVFFYFIPSALLAGLYGFIIGKIFENKSIKSNAKNTIGELRLFSLSAAGLFIAVRILDTIFLLVRLRGEPGFDYFFAYLGSGILSAFFSCLIVGAIGFGLAFLCLKCFKLRTYP
jgi:uncharacterized membrane protein